MPEGLGQFVTKAYDKGKPFWEKKNPKKRSKPLSAAQKKAAKARARKAGRPYPNLVDNAAVRRSSRKK